MSEEMVYPDDETTTPPLSVPDRWNIIQPEDETLPAMLHFYQNKKVIASIPLDEEVVKDLVKALNNYNIKEDSRTVLQKMTGYWKSHKIFGTLAALGIMLSLFFIISSAFVTK